ncbi:MAG TPA: FtsX-like permease family protein [Kofleriaceae bacterium]|nr:FtsX-like permease family protein [Kofleriaceae bacterium]
MRRSKTGAVLVAAQIALTLAIVCNAVFIVKARLAGAQRPSGVVEDEVFQLLYAPIGEPADPIAASLRDLQILRAIPGVKHVAEVNSIPLSRSGWGTGIATDPAKPETSIGVAAYFSGSSFVQALGLEIVEGRDFTEAEVRLVDPKTRALLPDHVIVSQHFSKRVFPTESALGKTLYLGTGPTARPIRVIGVVKTLMSSQAGDSPDAYNAAIFPLRAGRMNYVIRTAPEDRARVMAEAERQLSLADNRRVLVWERTMEQIRERRFRNERGGANLLIAITVGLLLVTASGIVGIASLWVNQRKKQIGVRRALGARRVDIIRYFITENVIITTVGIVLGIVLALALNQLLVSKVELARLPLTYVGGGTLAAWALGLLAVLGPAWRAASVPPAVATRST